MPFQSYNTLRISRVQQTKAQSATINYQSDNYALSDPLWRDFDTLTENEDTIPGRPDAAAVTRHNTRSHALFFSRQGMEICGK